MCSGWSPCAHTPTQWAPAMCSGVPPLRAYAYAGRLLAQGQYAAQTLHPISILALYRPKSTSTIAPNVSPNSPPSRPKAIVPWQRHGAIAFGGGAWGGLVPPHKKKKKYVLQRHFIFASVSGFNVSSRSRCARWSYRSSSDSSAVVDGDYRQEIRRASSVAWCACERPCDYRSRRSEAVYYGAVDEDARVYVDVLLCAAWVLSSFGDTGRDDARWSMSVYGRYRGDRGLFEFFFESHAASVAECRRTRKVAL